MPSKRTGKGDYKNVTPVLRIKPINRTNCGIIKHVGYLDHENQKLGDEIIELDQPLNPDPEIYGKHAIHICTIDNYEIVGRFYRVNIVGSHIVQSRRYPVMRFSIGYNKTITSGQLLDFFVSIEMNEDEKKAIEDRRIKENKPNLYLNLRYDGKTIQHIDCDKELEEDWEKITRSKLEDRIMTSISKDESTFNLSDEEMTELLNKRVNEEMEFHRKLMGDIELDNFSGVIRVRDQFIQLCEDSRFHDFLATALRCRVTQRRNEAGIDPDDYLYQVPEKVVKMSDVKQQLIDDGELADY